MNFSERILPIKSSLHGNGIQAACLCKSGEIIFSEIPRYIQQTVENRKYAFTCGYCFSFLGTIENQISYLTKALNRSSLCAASSSSEYKFIPCTALCGEFYCNTRCRDSHWNDGSHAFLCTGQVRDDEAEDHPLMQFKIHAISTNEIFLLVADVVVSIIGELSKIISENPSLPFSTAANIAIQPLDQYVRKLWWEAAVTPKSQKPVRFMKTLRGLVEETWALLDPVVGIQRRGLGHILSPDFVSRLIGMFEQNNVGVRLENPLATYCRALRPHTPETTAFLASLQAIVAKLEDGEGCEDEGCWADCEEDNGQTEPEEEEEEGENAKEPGDWEGQEGMEESSGDPCLDEIRRLVLEHGEETLFPPLDGTAFFLLICRINHSCEPNVAVRYSCLPHEAASAPSEQRHLLHPQDVLEGQGGGEGVRFGQAASATRRSGGLIAEMRALRDLLPGEELLQSYVDETLTYEDRRRALQEYGFVCCCPRCQRRE